MQANNSKALTRLVVGNNYFLAILGYALILVIAAPSVLSELVRWRFFEHVVQNRFVALALILAAYPAAQLVSSLFFTSSSDYRSTNLRYCATSLFGHVITGFGFLHHDLILVILGRAICGFCSEPLNRTFAGVKSSHPLLTGLAFVAGPAAASLIADNSMLIYFQSALPFWLLAGLTFVQLVLLSQFDISAAAGPGAPIKMRDWFSWLYASIKQIRRLTFFVFLAAWYLFIHFFSAVLFQRFEWSEAKIGFVYALIGFCFVLAYLFRPFRKPILLLMLLVVFAVVFGLVQAPFYFVACGLVVAFLSALTLRNSDWFIEGSLYFAPTTCLLTLLAIGLGLSLLSLSA